MYVHYKTEELTKQYKQRLKKDFLPILENATEALKNRNPEEIASVAKNLSKFLEDNGELNTTAIYVIVIRLSLSLSKAYKNTSDDGIYNLAMYELKKAITLINDLTD